jgi:hypothetical protein
MAFRSSKNVILVIYFSNEWKISKINLICIIFLEISSIYFFKKDVEFIEKQSLKWLIVDTNLITS